VILSAANRITLISNQFRKSRIYFNSAISSARTLADDDAGESVDAASVSG
jgi:hypothetical protein